MNPFKWLQQFFRGSRSAGTSDHGTAHSTSSWRERADRSDERAKRLGIDPPRPGRKTYAERYAETSTMSGSEIDAAIARREARGEECGVLYRVKANRQADCDE